MNALHLLSGCHVERVCQSDPTGLPLEVHINRLKSQMDQRIRFDWPCHRLLLASSRHAHKVRQKLVSKVRSCKSARPGGRIHDPAVQAHPDAARAGAYLEALAAGVEAGSTPYL